MNTSYLSQVPIPSGESVRAGDIREGIFALIRETYPGLEPDHYISLSELNRFRRLYLTALMEKEKGELAALDKEVMGAIRSNSILSEKIQDELEGELTFGQRLADRIAVFGGSWFFIVSFFLFILLWMIANLWLLTIHTFDPFPFILLNLILSCLAAIQAPIIMMSQNRQEQKDR